MGIEIISDKFNNTFLSIPKGNHLFIYLFCEFLADNKIRSCAWYHNDDNFEVVMRRDLSMYQKAKLYIELNS